MDALSFFSKQSDFMINQIKNIMSNKKGCKVYGVQNPRIDPLGSNGTASELPWTRHMLSYGNLGSVFCMGTRLHWHSILGVGPPWLCLALPFLLPWPRWWPAWWRICRGALVQLLLVTPVVGWSVGGVWGLQMQPSLCHSNGIFCPFVGVGKAEVAFI